MCAISPFSSPPSRSTLHHLHTDASIDGVPPEYLIPPVGQQLPLGHQHLQLGRPVRPQLPPLDRRPLLPEPLPQLRLALIWEGDGVVLLQVAVSAMFPVPQQDVEPRLPQVLLLLEPLCLLGDRSRLLLLAHPAEGTAVHESLQQLTSFRLEETDAVPLALAGDPCAQVKSGACGGHQGDGDLVAEARACGVTCVWEGGGGGGGAEGERD